MYVRRTSYKTAILHQLLLEMYSLPFSVLFIILMLFYHIFSVLSWCSSCCFHVLCSVAPLLEKRRLTKIQSPYFWTYMEPRNRFQGMDSASPCSLAGRYHNPIPTRCLAPIDFLKIPAQVARALRILLWRHLWNACCLMRQPPGNIGKRPRKQ